MNRRHAYVPLSVRQSRLASALFHLGVPTTYCRRVARVESLVRGNL